MLIDSLNFVAVTVPVVLLILIWLARQKVKKPVHRSRADVISALENLLSDEPVMHDEFDMFLSLTVVDPYLESVRKRVLEIVLRNSGNSMQDISPQGALEIKGLLTELRTNA